MRMTLFAKVASLQARQQMSYRADFWLTAVAGFALQMTVAWFLWTALFAESGKQVIGGFTFESMIFYYVLMMLLGKVVRASDRMGTVADEIYQGSLNRYIVYPVSYFPFKYAQALGDLPPMLIQLLLFGFVFQFILPVPESIQATVATLAMTVVSLVLANVLHFLLVTLVELAAFWADNVWSLNVMLRMTVNVLGGVMFPLTLYPEWAQEILAALPFQYLFFAPVMTLIGEVSFTDWLYGVAVTLAWIFAAAGLIGIVWRRGNLQYTGVGI